MMVRPFLFGDYIMSNIIKYDFQGNLFSFNMDGWINATEVAAQYGKRLDV